MSFSQSAHAGPSSIAQSRGSENGLRNTSRSGSIASLWSSADVPFFLDARRSSEATRNHSLASSRLLSDGHASSGASRSAAGSSRKGSHALLDVDEGHDEPGGRAWSRRDVPAGPMSPRPSVESSSFSLPRVSIASRPSVDVAGTVNAPPSPQTTSATSSSHRKSDSVGSSPRGFQTRKPAALQIQPVAYSSPLRSKSSDTPNNPSPGAQSTIAPSLATSPAPSQDTDASADLPTPMTFKSSHSKSRRSRNKGHAGSLYAKAEQFFSASYSMSTPPQTAHDFRSTEGRFVIAEQDSSTPSTSHFASAIRQQCHGHDSSAVGNQHIVEGPARLGMVEEGIGPTSILASPLHNRIAKTRSEHNSPATRFVNLPESPTRSRLAHTANNSPLQPAIALASQAPASPVSPCREGTPDRAAYNGVQSAGANARMRTHSTPRLHSDWLAAENTRLPLRKASFCPEALNRHMEGNGSIGASPRQQLRNISSQHADASAVSISSSGEPPLSPRTRLFRRSSRVGTPQGRAPSQRSRNASTASLTQSIFKPPKSPARPKSKAGWSSYLSEGLTLYLDQGGKNERSIKMPYLSYDPFGAPESLVHASQVAQAPGTPKKNKLRPASSREGFDNEVGILNFAHPSDAGPASMVVFSPQESSPVLRHLGIGEDTQADLLTRQATLSLSENGVHQVAGFERSGRVAWQFKYEVDETSDFDGQTFIIYKTLKPLSFACSATLLDPARARKARLLKMVKKGVSTNLTSNLVETSPGRVSSRDRSVSANTTVDLVSQQRLQSAVRQQQSVEERPRAAIELQADDLRRPSTMTNTSGGSVVRLDPGAVPIPANLPATVVPFKLRPSFSSVAPSPRGSVAHKSADVSGQDAQLRANSLVPGRPSQVLHLTSRDHMTRQAAEHAPVRRAATSQGTSTTATERPRTAAEEIKRQYLERAGLADVSESDAQDCKPATPTRPRSNSGRQHTPKAPHALHESRSFAAIKSESRQHLRKAISTKALPGLPARPITAQNLSAANPQASASLLVELGFI